MVSASQYTILAPLCRASPGVWELSYRTRAKRSCIGYGSSFGDAHAEHPIRQRWYGLSRGIPGYLALGEGRRPVLLALQFRRCLVRHDDDTVTLFAMSSGQQVLR